MGIVAKSDYETLTDQLGKNRASSDQTKLCACFYSRHTAVGIKSLRHCLCCMMLLGLHSLNRNQKFWMRTSRSTYGPDCCHTLDISHRLLHYRKPALQTVDRIHHIGIQKLAYVLLVYRIFSGDGIIPSQFLDAVSLKRLQNY